jgi:hypothetical protein
MRQWPLQGNTLRNIHARLRAGGSQPKHVLTHSAVVSRLIFGSPWDIRSPPLTQTAAGSPVTVGEDAGQLVDQADQPDRQPPADHLGQPFTVTWATWARAHSCALPVQAVNMTPADSTARTAAVRRHHIG